MPARRRYGQHDVFISYATREGASAQHLVHALERCWIARSLRLARGKLVLPGIPRK